MQHQMQPSFRLKSWLQQSNSKSDSSKILNCMSRLAARKSTQTEGKQSMVCSEKLMTVLLACDPIQWFDRLTHPHPQSQQTWITSLISITCIFKVVIPAKHRPSIWKISFYKLFLGFIFQQHEQIWTWNNYDQKVQKNNSTLHPAYLRFINSMANCSTQGHKHHSNDLKHN